MSPHVWKNLLNPKLIKLCMSNRSETEINAAPQENGTVIHIDAFLSSPLKQFFYCNQTQYICLTQYIYMCRITKKIWLNWIVNCSSVIHKVFDLFHCFLKIAQNSIILQWNSFFLFVSIRLVDSILSGTVCEYSKRATTLNFLLL